ncbi:MAG: zinc-ribbon domain-containing protein [Chloroflexota bacterium]|nr:zinc-ribbon domain-containing protein [Chloroflexota bacterium]MDQ5867872.1 zinc-ribbon domain-containing protein [Chloroflexota bacterium]
MAKAQRTNQAATQVCPTCGKSVVPDDGYCPNCGAPIDSAAAQPASGGGTSASPIVCPVCSTTNAPGTEYCSNCGAALAQVLGSAVAVPGGDGVATGIKCGVCGHDIPPGEDYCPNCGAPRSASVQLPAPGATDETAPGPTTCPNCGANLRPGAKFCRECGTRFDSIATGQKSEGGLNQLKPGQVLAGRYKIQKVIGGGGMGAVFKGVDMNLTSRAEPEGRQVAVKAILDTTDPELLAAAVEEREMLVRLDHPNIVRIYDIVNEGGVPYIVMAFVKGKGWKQLYDENGGPLPETEALRLILGMRGAFEYLHRRVPPVVYRDFKPGQVIEVTDPNGEKRQVLIDLGTAMEYFPGQKRQAWGTVGFAPPEIGGIVEQPPTMDLFGIVSTLAALLGVAVDRQPILAPPRHEWGVSEEIYDFVMRGRDPDPRVRFQTVEELFNQLEGINRFIQGQERARVVGSPQVSGGQGTRTLSQVLVPVQSTIITGKLFNQQVTGKIGALPVLSVADPAQQLLQPARDLIDAGRYLEALSQLDVVLRAHPASIDGHLLRATALNNLGRSDEARAALDQANRLGTPATRWRTLLVQAQAAETQNDYATAEALFQELIRLVPGEVLPKQALADLYSETHRYDEAAELYSRVVAADPANADAVLGWADSLVALNRTDVAIGVLDAVNENALRYVDAQLRLVELYLARIDSYLNRNPTRLTNASLSSPDVQGMLRDLDLAGRAIAALNDRTESRHFYRLQADWWYAAYRLSKAALLPKDIHWPDSRPDHTNAPAQVGQDCRAAYRRYLQRAPDAPDREEVLARIYFDVREWQ